MAEYHLEEVNTQTVITDWNSIQINLNGHGNRYLRSIHLINRTAGTDTELGSVGCLVLTRLSRFGVGNVETLRQNDLFGYYMDLTWEGSIKIEPGMQLFAYFVPDTADDDVYCHVVVSDEPGTQHIVDKPPRNRLIQALSTASSGAGGTTTITLTCPVGRRWVFICGTFQINEAVGNPLTLNVQSSSTLINNLFKIATAGSGVLYTYPAAAVASTPPICGTGAYGYVLERNSIVLSIAGVGASKTLQLGYTILEEPDSKYPAPT